MPFCPKCRSEYRADFTRCAACDVDLVEEADLPEQLSDEEVIAAMADSELTSVAEGTLEGLKPVQQLLVDKGYPAALRKSEELMTEAGRYLRLELLVRKSDEEEAGVLVRQALMGVSGDEIVEMPADQDEEEGDDEGEGEGQPACPACGSTEPLVDGECPDCGLFLGEG